MAVKLDTTIRIDLVVTLVLSLGAGIYGYGRLNARQDAIELQDHQHYVELKADIAAVEARDINRSTVLHQEMVDRDQMLDEKVQNLLEFAPA